MVHMGDLEIISKEISKLYSDAGYWLWKENAEASKITKVQLVKEVFAKLLGVEDSQKIAVRDYLRFSFVYICEGSLQGALHIMRIASSRDHLTNVLILFQIWSLLQRIEADEEDDKILLQTYNKNLDQTAESYINYICKLITLEDRDSSILDIDWRNHKVQYIQKSEFRLSFAYLLCSSHLLRVSESAYEPELRRTALFRYEAIMMEAFYLNFGIEPKSIDEVNAWYNSPTAWMEMGSELEDSPFVLIAETAYWEAFTRSLRAEEHLRRMVRIYRQTKRPGLVRPLLEEAYHLSPLNGYVRRALLEIGGNAVWEEKFMREHKLVSRVQAVVRGIGARNAWVMLKPELVAYKIRLDKKWKSIQKSILIRNRKQSRRVLKYWFDHADSTRIRYFKAATKIQSFWRTHIAVKTYKSRLLRTYRANGKYIIACEFAYDKLRGRKLLQWYRFLRRHQLRRHAMAIADTLSAQRIRAILDDNLNRIAVMIRLHRLHVCRRNWGRWLKRFRERTQNHARVTIRFFIRAVLINLRHARMALRLEACERRVRDLLVMKKWPLVRQLFSHWLLMRNDRKLGRAWDTLARNFSAILSNHRRQRQLSNARAMFELRQTVLIKYRFRVVHSVLIMWQQLGAVRRIQRCIRCFLARRRRVRRRVLIKRVTVSHNRHIGKLKARIIDNWQRFVRLQILDRNLLKRKFCRIWATHLRNRKISRVLIHKKRDYKLLAACHKAIQRQVFSQFRRNVVKIRQYLTILPFFKMILNSTLRNGFRGLRHLTATQSRLLDLSNISIVRKIDHIFWRGAGSSVHIMRGEVAWQEDMRKLMQARRWTRWRQITESTKTQGISLFHPWETRLNHHPSLLDFEKLQLLKSFRVWIATYRLRMRHNREAAMDLAPIILNAVTALVNLRRLNVIKIQRFLKRHLARRCVRYRRKRRMMEGEREVAVMAIDDFTNVRKFFRDWIRARQLQYDYAVKIQCMVRRIRAFERFRNAAQYRLRLCSMENKLQLEHSKSVLLVSISFWRDSFVARVAREESIWLSETSAKGDVGADSASNKSENSQLLSTHNEASSPWNKILEEDEKRLMVSRSLDQLKSHQALLRGSSNAHRNSQHSEGILKPIIIIPEKGSVLDFQSLEFHRKQTLLRKGGVFVWELNTEGYCDFASTESSATADSYATLKASPSQNKKDLSTKAGLRLKRGRNPPIGLSPPEVRYFVQEADTVLCQVSGESVGEASSSRSSQSGQERPVRSKISKVEADVLVDSIKTLMSHFRGRKMIFSGGYLSRDATKYLCQYLLSRHHFKDRYVKTSFVDSGEALDGTFPWNAASSSRKVGTKRSPSHQADGVALHFCRILVPMPSLRVFCQFLGSGLGVRELSVDEASVGIIGMALLMISVAGSWSLQTLIMTLSSRHHQCQRSIAIGLKKLSENHTLKELRLTGVGLQRSVLTALREGIKAGWKGLDLLEISVTKDESSAAEDVVRVARDRTAESLRHYSGPRRILDVEATGIINIVSGLSVTVNEINS